MAAAVMQNKTVLGKTYRGAMGRRPPAYIREGWRRVGLTNRKAEGGKEYSELNKEFLKLEHT